MIKVELTVVVVPYCMLSTSGSPKTLLCGHWVRKLPSVTRQSIAQVWLRGPKPPPTHWFDPYTLSLPPCPNCC